VHDHNLEQRIQAFGHQVFRLIENERPSIFNTDWWTGKILDWAMRNEEFKVQLFRFVDVLPSLQSEAALLRHVEEYFGQGGSEVPAVLRWGSKSEGLLGSRVSKLLAASLKKNIEAMAGQFIMGENAAQALAAIDNLRQEGFAFCVDILGEAAVSEEEAADYQRQYLDLLASFSKRASDWLSLGGANSPLDWGDSPKINLAVKPTSFYSQADPRNFTGSVEGIYQRLLPLAEQAAAADAFLCIDMEQHRYKDITLAVYRKLKEQESLKNYPHLGIVLQAYLKESRNDLKELLEWSAKAGTPIAIRLVKGAYWDYETVTAAANGWPSPVFANKYETDTAFEEMAAEILAHHDLCHLACASHNIRSIAMVHQTAALRRVPADRYEFQMLYGMAGPVRRAVLKLTGRLRLYGPYGALLPGMGYLVRRLLENTSNQSFLRLHFVEGEGEEQLLADPAASRPAREATSEMGPTADRQTDELPSFRNQPAADFSRRQAREAFPTALAEMREQIGRHYPLLISNTAVPGRDKLESTNPADPREIVGSVALAGAEEIDQAAAAAASALPGWRAKPVAERAACLFKTAAIMRQRMYHLAALQILEVGKQWNEAHADVAEAIDFCEYYGREMLRLEKTGGTVLSAPGEENRYRYLGKGVAAVIAPWNFPLAISCGMSAAALVSGNCVLYKPSGLSQVCGAHLAEIFQESGLPAGVFNFIPCRGGEMGDYLVSHPGVHLIAFTGSVAVGSRIAALAARPAAGQQHLKKVIAELGGKNGIIIDEDADLDEAVPGVLRSAFGFQGQKCSACSRVIIVQPIYDRFVRRLTAAARSLSIGPATDPAHVMGPVVDREAQKKILAYLEIARQEGEILYQSPVPEKGWYVPLTLVGGIKPEHRLAREEIFGPIVSLMTAPTFADAIDIANATPYGLTGGVYSRSPGNLHSAAATFRVGNLYLNRGITGALVGRQPFGGFKMSGIGSKAGGPDYLLQFVDPQCVTENTMRRGFAPWQQ
jgi:RHH-type proline utilization regulon transcriptional repressor/proline dehydrogenase/delta 1-pyrroline-5-carboxylate dehydrogenase